MSVLFSDTTYQHHSTPSGPDGCRPSQAETAGREEGGER